MERFSDYGCSRSGRGRSRREFGGGSKEGPRDLSAGSTIACGRGGRLRSVSASIEYEVGGGKERSALDVDPARSWFGLCPAGHSFLLLSPSLKVALSCWPSDGYTYSLHAAISFSLYTTVASPLHNSPLPSSESAIGLPAASSPECLKTTKHWDEGSEGY